MPRPTTCLQQRFASRPRIPPGGCRRPQASCDNANVMKRILPILILATVAAGAPAWAVGVGEAAPAFALNTAKGEPVALDKLRGQVVYVDFWASWCGPCKRSFPWMNELAQRYGANGLTVVAVNVDK